MNARAALFDVYGDHLRSRGGVAPVASLLALLEPLGVTAPAVRTAISRMVKQGWLVPERTEGGPGYRVTPRAVQRLGSAAERIYRDGLQPWDGRWRLLVLERVVERVVRDRVRSGLRYLGYGLLGEDTWISPRGSDEADALLGEEGVAATRFVAELDGDDRVLAARAWDLEALAASYERWLVSARTIVGTGPPRDDRHAFVRRSTLVHEWRKFLFTDPALPAALLPTDWPGGTAAAYFDRESQRLLDSAARYVDRCLDRKGDQR